MVTHFFKRSYQKVKDSLSKTRSALGGKLRSLFGKELNEEVLDQLEELLYSADLGVDTTTEIVEKIRAAWKGGEISKGDDLVAVVKNHLIETLEKNSIEPTEPKAGEPHVILIVGVNGNGKTTSVAKLAKLYKDNGQKVILGAADTYRAAAMDQLDMWATRVGADIVKGAPNSDPASVTFDTVTAARARGADVALIDTAGRLHTKIDLMQELEKIKRVCQKVQSGAPNEVLLVLDATTGQNAIDQARIFHKYVTLSGVILTKLDGTAKGGIVVSIHRELAVPVRFMGTGEGMDDLQPFDATEFVEALFES
jgi:fused signal recognition particle receptor